jgi:hypothetical protein
MVRPEAVQIERLLEVTDVVPGLEVETMAVKTPPAVAEVGMLVMLGVVGVMRLMAKVSAEPVAAW